MQRIVLNTSSIDSKIAELTKVKENTAICVEKFNDALPTIEATLANLGLQLIDVRYSKTGMETDKWESGDKLRFNCSAGATACQPFKFITHRHGNDSVRKNKAARVKNKLTDVCDFIVAINEFSVENRSLLENDPKNQVLIEFWISL